ncbi:DAK2 domain-containing protein [Kineococcus sp. LSe6-4]|uniref:DAK2 domain-containing protein n=1 Tax=Kineococcus halophytocola TaxID=3234027 RepID=A0ABV4GV99_9ACTN
MKRPASTTTTGAPAGTLSPLDELELRRDGRRVDPVAGTRAADLDVRRVLLWWRGFEHQLRTRSEELHGLGPELERAAAAADDVLRERTPELAGDVFAAVATGFAASPGLPSLLAPWFGEFARSCGRQAGTRELADAAQAGLAAVQRAGAPATGAGSLVDAMAPAADALAGADIADVPAVAALNAAYRAAADGTRHTVVDGAVDAGALAVTWFFERGTVV